MALDQSSTTDALSGSFCTAGGNGSIADAVRRRVSLAGCTGAPSGGCWTCVKRNIQCGAELPHCRNCITSRRICGGYRISPQWARGAALARRRSPAPPRPPNPRPQSWSHPSEAIPSSMSTLGLPQEENFFMQHFLRNVARVALSIDYDANGYRCLLPIATSEPIVMNAMLAIATSHYSRWQQVSDSKSRVYLRQAIKDLQTRFKESSALSNTVTILSMLLIVSYEVFAGSNRWYGHFQAIRSWVCSRSDNSDLDPFVKTWICLIETQCALNLGQSTLTESHQWMELASSWGWGKDFIDPLIGCSVRLPLLMSQAARLYASSKLGVLSVHEVRQQAESLQSQIRATKLEPTSRPSLAILCDDRKDVSLEAMELNQAELSRILVAAAEIFRHALHIYVYRLVYGDTASDSDEIRSSVQDALQQLTLVPDVTGPATTLGWNLIVIGAEVDNPEQRAYIRTRLSALHLLGINNTKSAENILEKTWEHRDLVLAGKAAPTRWQNIMEQLNEVRVLI